MLRKLLYVAACLAMAVAMVGCEGSDDSGPSIGSRGDGGGFLWKPLGEHSRKLVILLPSQYRGKVASVHVANSNGDVLEVGVFTIIANGNRPHYRFSKAGASYGNDLYAVADMNSGDTVHWPIPRGGTRTEY